MHWFTAVLVFVMVWWVVLFAVLPLWTRPNAEADDLTGWRGVPDRPLLARKLLATTLLSLLIWAVIMWMITSSSFSFRSSRRTGKADRNPITMRDPRQMIVKGAAAATDA